ncbi:hypothetical protein M404DRAFT_32128 [Pisolithus tinctorius Marx 270]|uniref:Uncharacterized protein n=1 Tax=Pisolithus tinctorius Marx 270 TaxID=870435 RepID=A0A0C3NQR5_PISTI|nr:hypothetical protein M404DRAFT_32128 [Pisolithus tinctorius Marx 270]
MSFLPSPGHLLGADLWPGDLQTIIQNHVSIHQLQQWECFPTSLCHMIEWATVARHLTAPDRRRSHLLVYKTLPIPEPCDALYPVSVRIYGFLDKFCVSDFGNWNGDCARAACAVQSLTINSMGNTAAWRNQIECLNLAATFASCILKIPLPSVQFRHHLHLQRKVFSKRLFDLQESQAARNNSPHAQNAHIPKLPEYPWEWNGPLEILEMQQDGNVTPIHELLLSRGDFVEIDAEFDLVVARNYYSQSPATADLAPQQATNAPLATNSPTEVQRIQINQISEEQPSVHPSESTMQELDPSSSQLTHRHSTGFMPVNTAPL